MNDPQNLGLGELGQRVQAMSDPVTDSRLRPYQGASLPASPASNGRPIPPYEPAPYDPATPALATPLTQPTAQHASVAHREPMEDVRIAPLPPPNPVSLPPYGSVYGLGSSNGQASALGAFADPAFPHAPASTVPQEPPASNWEQVVAASQSPNSDFGGTVTPGTSSQLPSTPAATSQLTAPAVDPNAPKSGLQKALDAIRSALPLVQRLLPLLDGNFATAIGALVAPQAHQHPPAQPVKVDLEPIERGLTEVRNSHRELRTQVLEQVVVLKKVEDQLDRVREATDRNTLEQQELVEDLRSVGNRVNVFAIVGVVLLAVSLVLNIFLVVQLQHILR